MKHLFFLVFLFASVHSLAQENPFSDVQLQLIKDNTKDFPTNTNIAFAIINNEEVYYFGLQKRDSVYSEIDNRLSIFEIGSITKTFTSNIMTQLYLEKVIDINKPIKKYLKIKLKDKPKFTSLNLSNHTAGLPRLPSNLMADLSKYPNNPYAHYTNKELEYYLQNELSLVEEIGVKSLYSNLGTGILAYTLCTVTKKPLEDLYRERIFVPFDMIHTSSTRENITLPVVVGLDEKGNKVSGWDFDALAGAGSILSNTEDMSKYAFHMMEDNALNNLMSKETIAINDKMGVGLAWHLIKNENGNNYLWHNGGTGGYSSSICIDRLNKNAVVVLSNLSNTITKNHLDILSIELTKSMNK